MTGLLIGGLSLFLVEPLSTLDENLGGSDVALITGASLGAAAFVAGVVGIVLAIADPQVIREGASREWRLSFD